MTRRPVYKMQLRCQVYINAHVNVYKMYNGYGFILGLDGRGHCITSGVEVATESVHVMKALLTFKDVNDRNCDSLDMIIE